MSEKRIIETSQIKEAVIDLVYRANFHLPRSVEEGLRELVDSEKSEMARTTLGILYENAEIARKDEIPLCQDCGVVIVFFELGQDVILKGAQINEVINSGVADAYQRFHLRKSVAGDPIERKNTGTNTPCFIHTSIVEGRGVKLIVYIKGGGSENMTVINMFRPTASVNDIIDFIEHSVINGGINACPPLFLGIGIGGTADIALLNAKRAVLRKNKHHKDPFYADLEIKILERLNNTGIGPLGFGGDSTAAGVYIKTAPSHIATLPVALNLNCHSLRFRECEL